MYEFHFRLARSFIQGRANLVTPLPDRPTRGVDDAKDFGRNIQAIVSARPASSRSPGLMDSSCHSSNEPRLAGCYCLCVTPRRDGSGPDVGGSHKSPSGKSAGTSTAAGTDSVRRLPLPVPLGRRAPPSGQLSGLRGRARSSATRVAPASGCKVRTDKWKCAPFEAGAEHARLKVVTCCEMGASSPSLI
jgi:hypothetical protein